MESHTGSRVEYMIKAKAQFKRRSTANNVEINVPVPDDAAAPKFRVGTVFIVACFLFTIQVNISSLTIVKMVSLIV